MRRRCREVSIALFLLWITQIAVAQDFPAKTVRVVVSFPPGGTADILMRVLVDPLSERWKRPVIIDYRPGAGSVVGTETVARAPPDGHTLLVVGATFLTNPLLRAKVPYDVFKDFAPVTLLVTSPLVLIVNSSSAAKSLRDLLDEARARPGKLSYATTGAGSTHHVLAEMLKIEAGVDWLHVPYAGGGRAVSALLGNHVDFVIVNYSEAASNLAAGKLRALALASLERFDLLPDVPTIAESGFKDVYGNISFGIVVPAGTPKDTIARIQTDLVSVLRVPAVRDKLVAQGLYPVGSTPEEFETYMRATSAKFDKVIRAAGIKAD